MIQLLFEGEHLSQTYDLKVLRRLAIFVLNRATRDLQSELYDYLVMIALSDDLTQKGMTKVQIISSIEIDLKISNFPEKIVELALFRLLKKGSINVVRNVNNEIYLLS